MGATASIVGILRFHYGWEPLGERIIGDIIDCGVTTVSCARGAGKIGIARVIATRLSADMRGLGALAGQW